MKKPPNMYISSQKVYQVLNNCGRILKSQIGLKCSLKSGRIWNSLQES